MYFFNKRIKYSYFSKEKKKNLENTAFRSFVVFRTLVFILISILFVTEISYGQTKRPKIGLVLSGGGAKGMAHVGVLKAMEEAGLTPDYITGTSMGSIVGGLYSIGYSADELKELISTIDWDAVLSNNIPMNKVAFEEKPFYGRYLMDFYVDNKKLALPKGIIEGQSLMELFSRLTRPVHGINDFNDFPIPFSCIATNIATGEPVTLNHGSLAMSMRASMAIPSIFTPIVIDDQLLVDGGLVRNFPVQEVIDMGADIVIGVFVSSDLNPEEELNSIVAILTQSAFVTSAFDSREQMKKCDILIEPDLKGFSTGSFHSAEGILEKGNEAGQAYLQKFKDLADSLKSLGPLKEVVKPEIIKEYLVNNIEILGNKSLPDEFIIGKLRIKKDETITISHIENRITVLFGTLYFEKIWYEILFDGTGYTLRLYVREKPKTQLRFSYHYDSENKGGIVGNVTLRNILLPGSRLIAEADLAVHPSILANYFKYLGKGQNVALTVDGLWSKDELPVYDEKGSSTGIFSSNYIKGAVGIQTTRVQNNAFGVYIQWANSITKPKVISDSLRVFNRVQYYNSSINGFFRHNSMNHRYFPTKGTKFSISYKSVFYVNAQVSLGDSVVLGPEELDDLLDSDRIHSLFIDYIQYIPLSKKISLFPAAGMNISNLSNTTFNLSEYYFVGGFFPRYHRAYNYWGANQNEFKATNFFYAAIGLQYEVFRNVFLRGIVNYIDAEYPMKWIYNDIDASELGDRYRRFGFGFLAGYKSPLGPMAISIAKDHYRNSWKTSLIIGYVN